MIGWLKLILNSCVAVYSLAGEERSAPGFGLTSITRGELGCMSSYVGSDEQPMSKHSTTRRSGKANCSFIVPHWPSEIESQGALLQALSHVPLYHKPLTGGLHIRALVRAGHLYF